MVAYIETPTTQVLNPKDIDALCSTWGELVGDLLEHLEPKILEDGEHLAEHQAPAVVVDF